VNHIILVIKDEVYVWIIAEIPATIVTFTGKK
jgi:hypothetical protein